MAESAGSVLREEEKAVFSPAAGWPVTGWEIVDTMLPPDVVEAGDFDLSGVLAVLSAKVQAMKIGRIVFDSLDVLLHMLPGPQERRRERL